MQRRPAGSLCCPVGRFAYRNYGNQAPITVAVVDSEPQETALIATPVGWLRLSARGGFLIGVDFEMASGEEYIPKNSVLEAAAHQLSLYFEKPENRFFLPLNLAGTEYMRRVWTALTEIPPGCTETYGSLAHRLDSGPRAVAGACRANAFPILIPCHRVVAAHGLGGYCGRMNGPMLEIKRWLLKHEGCALD
jgi:methylated-DNA-[protein]-cysteine S-methyltransferase